MEEAPAPERPQNVVTPLWDHQKRAIFEACEQQGHVLPGYALFMEPGTGKTRTLIEILRRIFNTQKRVHKTLVLCPPIVIQNWRDEILKYSKIPPGEIELLYKAGKVRLKQIQDSRSRIFVTNYETLLMKDCFEALQAWGAEVLVLDESHKCKDLKADRTKAAVRLANGLKDKHGSFIYYPIKYRYLLTGSPVLNSPADLFSQFLILDGGATFGDNFFAFRGIYFKDHNAGMPSQRYFPDWRITPEGEARISKLIAPKSIRALKKDCLDLPPYVVKVIGVDLAPAQRKAYESMKSEYIAWLEREGKEPSAIIANLAITKALRLMQFASGFAKTVDGDELCFQDNPKSEALRELLSELTPNHKVIVWAVFQSNYAEIRRICARLGIRAVEVHGATPASERFRNVELFNDDPSVRVFIGHPGAGGIGINLVSSDVSVVYSRNFSLEQSIQSEARNYRGGSERHASVTRYDLVARETIDELIQKALDQKVKISDSLLREISLKRP